MRMSRELKYWYEKLSPVYRTLRRVEEGQKRMEARLLDRQERLFWLQAARPGETAGETRRRVFREMPRAQGTLRAAQLGNLAILREVGDLCRESGLTYCLAAGTLLGAVRQDVYKRQMLLFGVDFTWQILWLLPHLVLLFLLVFAAGSWCLHLGVFIEDLQNVSTVLLKLMFYFSGVFYDITTMVPAPYNRWLITLNPVALVMQGCRGAILYRTGPDWGYLLGWTAAALLAAAGGTAMVYRYENSYGKVL